MVDIIDLIKRLQFRGVLELAKKWQKATLNFLNQNCPQQVPLKVLSAGNENGSFEK